MLWNGACGGVTGGGGGRSEGGFARPPLLGERMRYGRGRTEPLLERPAAGVSGRALDHYSRGSTGVKEGARMGMAGGGMTREAGRRRGEHCRDRWGERRRHGQGLELSLPAGHPALAEGAQVLPEETSAGVSAGGDGKCDQRGRPLVCPEATTTTTTTTAAATATTMRGPE